MEDSDAKAPADSRTESATAGAPAAPQVDQAVGEDLEGVGQEERKKRRKVWKKTGRPNKVIPPQEQTAVFGETPRIRRQRYPKQVQRVIAKSLDRPIAGPATVALLDTRGKIITELDVREMASSVLRHFGGYEGLGKLLRFQHDESKPGSPTRTKTLELVAKLIEKGAASDAENDLSKQGLKMLTQRAAILADIVKRVGGEHLLIAALKQGAADGKE